ncbi:MAG TPA: MoaD/ThiS family protein [Vicinamibacterales bacterium]|nr:MoaD/ThiS family protein [Vicinamibacterales bacterium]
MRVKVQLFARLRELAGRGECDCEVPAGASVGDVWRAVADRHVSLRPFGGAISCALNADFARMNAPVQEGDEIAFLPPVSGG